MSRASRQEIEERIEQIIPLLLDGLRPAEIHRLLANRYEWAVEISRAQFDRYLALARARIAAQAKIDRAYEIGAARLRNERIMARAAANKDMRTVLAANRAQTVLLGLAASIPVDEAPDPDALRQRLADEIAEVLADEQPRLREQRALAKKIADRLHRLGGDRPDGQLAAVAHSAAH